MNVEGFESRVHKDGPIPAYMPNLGPCWLWTGQINTVSGYGYANHVLAHRMAYELAGGVIPPQMEIDHLCRVPACVNPSHLEAVTHSVNMLRAFKARPRPKRTHCKHGHAFDLANTRINRDGTQACRACARLGAARSRRRKKQPSPMVAFMAAYGRVPS